MQPKGPDIKPAHRAVAGAIGGAASSIVCSPLDVARTRIQLRAVIGAQTSRPGARQPYASLVSALGHIYTNEGLAGFFRGLSASLSTVPLFYMAFFPAYEGAKSYMYTSGIQTEWIANTASAIAAGALADSLTNPLWVIRIRMQSQHMHSHCAMDAPQKGLLSTAADIRRHEGLRAFYKGYVATLLGLSHVAIQLPLYEQLKSWLALYGTCGILTAAALSKIVATSITYPHELVRTRLQDQRSTGSASSSRGPAYRGVFHCARTVIRTEGLTGLYAGLQVNLIRAVPTTMTTFVVYEKVLHLLQR